MSDADGTCEYILDPDEPETWNETIGDRVPILPSEKLDEDGKWHCPYNKSKEGDNFCIYHKKIEIKDEKEVENRFKKLLLSDKSNHNSIELIGAKFGDVQLSDISSITGDEVDLSFTEFNSFSIEQCTINTDFILHGSKFNGVLDFSDVCFKQRSVFSSSIFYEKAKFSEINEGKEEYKFSTFESDARFERAVFMKQSVFSYVNFQKAEFRNCTFESECKFDLSSSNLGVDFSKSKFRGKTTFLAAEFNSAIFENTQFQSDTVFSGIKHEQMLSFESSVIMGDADFNEVDLTGVNFTEVDVYNGDFESALMSRSQLFGADFRGTKLYGAVLGDVRIDEDTQFLGHPDDDSDSSPHTFSAIRSKPCCVYDPNHEKDNNEPNPDKAKSVYRALEELAGKAARTRLQSQCFVRRQDLQKDGYKQDAKEAESWQERLIAGARYSRAKVARTTLLYGESPWRIIGGSIGFIFRVSLLYPFGEWLRPAAGEPITYSRILGEEWSLLLESLYFSTLTFTTLGIGDYEPMGFGQVLATLNTALGAVLIALLVFVLGRRAAR